MFKKNEKFYNSVFQIANIDLPVYTNDDGSFSRREYCFVEFDDEEAVNNACNAGTHTIGATTVS